MKQNAKWFILGFATMLLGALALSCGDPVAPYPVWKMNCEYSQIHQYIEAKIFADDIYQARFLFCDPPWHMDSTGTLRRSPPLDSVMTH